MKLTGRFRGGWASVEYTTFVFHSLYVAPLIEVVTTYFIVFLWNAAFLWDATLWNAAR